MCGDKERKERQEKGKSLISLFFSFLYKENHRRSFSSQSNVGEVAKVKDDSNIFVDMEEYERHFYFLLFHSLEFFSSLFKAPLSFIDFQMPGKNINKFTFR